MKTIFKKINTYIPLVPLVIFFFFILAVITHITIANSVAAADFVNSYIAPIIRGTLAHLTSWLPFSLAEFVLISSPVILAVLIVYCFRMAYADENETGRSYNSRLSRYIASLFSAAALIYTVFIFGFAAGYSGSTIEARLELDRQAVSAEELRDTAFWLLEETEATLDEIDFVYEGFSLMPYSLDEMNDKLNDAFSKLRETYDFIPGLRSNIKHVLLSEPMTYTHISGVYTFFSGEANLNINFPDYTLPYTAAHELSHQRGVAREDEANFIAFLVCASSDDAYIRYSGYQNLFEYVTSALYSANPDNYYEVISETDLRIRYEMASYSEFFDKYRDSTVSEVSGAINDTYLKAQGQKAGSKSYGRVVDLAVAYFKTLN
ncbi:MAG: DUF3810 domain-containing protein [Clostridia bacterium]|nr:DUF3810 domain-containing protein [Clostridia bacterium]